MKYIHFTLALSFDDMHTCFFSVAASIGGMLLNFNCMLILILVLRKCHTLIRSTPLAGILPLDQHISFHKMVGGVIGVCAAVHAGAHIAHAGINFVTCLWPIYSLMLPYYALSVPSQIFLWSPQF